MDEPFRDRLAREVPDWVDEGVITSSQAQRLLDRYDRTPSRRSTSSADWTSSLLYGTAAVLLGAAAIAFVFVGLDPGFKPPYLLGTGLSLAAAALAVALWVPERDLLADALLAAGMAPMAISPIEGSLTSGEALTYGLPAIALPAVYLVWRREQPFLPTLAVVAFTVATGATVMELFSDAATGTNVWMAVQALLLAGLVGTDRWLRDRDAGAPVTLAVLALAASLIPFLFESVNISDSETLELVLGGILLAILTAGVLLRHRGVVLGAAIGVGIDAIVFAFDVGGVPLGTGLLVGLAALLIWQAEALKGWIEDTASPGR